MLACFRRLRVEDRERGEGEGERATCNVGPVRGGGGLPLQLLRRKVNEGAVL